VDRTIASHVTTAKCEATNCMLINVTARSIKANNCIIYNVVDDSEVGLGCWLVTPGCQIVYMDHTGCYVSSTISTACVQTRSYRSSLLLTLICGGATGRMQNGPKKRQDIN
jgi:hypothetical protein